ncbi:MAG: hypothetical protein H5U01_14720, partial [Clostridia bacterium]|nr:hypothetical protein [Clostridia bacterium]
MLALVVSGVMPVFFSFVADHYRRNAGAAAGMIGGIASLVGAGVAPAIFGYLLDHFAAGTVFGAAAFVTLIGLGALIRAARKAP